MKILNLIVEIITSPFTILFRTKSQKISSKNVSPLLVLLIALAITATCLILFYYKELFE